MYSEFLEKHKELRKRKSTSVQEFDTLSQTLKDEKLFKDINVTVFCAGSLGRYDVGEKSDVDFFVISKDNNLSQLDKLQVLARLIQINDKLKYPRISNDGQFLKVYSLDDMVKATGKPKDDYENLFTVRMLLLLESKPLINTTEYDNIVQQIAGHYFRDENGRRVFKPLFLLNDILRWWRTVCLNYEVIRNETDKPWRKKNINLKFSRLLTVFGTVLALVTNKNISAEEFFELTKRTPLERLSIGFERLNDRDMLPVFGEILNDYEVFLSWKEVDSIDEDMKKESQKQNAMRVADRFSKNIYRAVNHKNIDEQFRRFLVI